MLALAAEATSAFFAYPVVGSAAATNFLLCILGLLILGMASGIAGIIHAQRMRWLSVLGFGFAVSIVILHLSA